MKVLKMKNGYYAVRKLSLFGWVYLDIATASYFLKCKGFNKHVVLSTEEEAHKAMDKYKARLELEDDIAHFQVLKEMEDKDMY